MLRAISTYRNDVPPQNALPPFLTALTLLFIWMRYLILLATIRSIYLLTAPFLAAFDWPRPSVVRPRSGVRQSVVQAFAPEPTVAHIQGRRDAQGYPVAQIQRARAAFTLWSLFLTSLILMSIMHGQASISTNLSSCAHLTINQPVKVVPGQAVAVNAKALSRTVAPGMSVVAAEFYLQG